MRLEKLLIFHYKVPHSEATRDWRLAGELKQPNK